MKKITVRAHSNIAFVKYWGRKDEKVRLPTNGSISMNLSNLYTTTTVEFDTSLVQDDITINGDRQQNQLKRVSEHLDRIREKAGIETKARVSSLNNFPTGTGLSSSASGFAALTYAAVHAAELTLTEREISILARQGSGSACRSIPSGFVEWKDATTSEESYAYSLHTPDYWDICDVVAIISSQQKDVPTSEGQTRVKTSLFFEERIRHIQNKIETCKQYLAERNFEKLGILAEMEAMEMHAVMLTSWPSLIYWLPETIMLMKQIQRWRQDGLPIYFTINTGQDVHVLCQKKDVKQVSGLLHSLQYVKDVIENSASRGAYVITDP
jgi:diphosphomevalonate decarboxylase